MTITLSPGLGRLQRLVGIEFPQADEDALWRCAHAWRTAATDLRRLSPDAIVVGTQVHAALGGELAIAFTDAWRPFSADEGLFDRLAQACDELAAECDHAASEVEYAKLAFILALLVLASTLSAITAVLVVGGIAALAIPLAIRTAQLTIRLGLTHLALAVAFALRVHATLDALLRAVRFGPGLFDAAPDLGGAQGAFGLPGAPSGVVLTGAGSIGGFDPSSEDPIGGLHGTAGLPGSAPSTGVGLAGHSVPIGQSTHDSGPVAGPVSRPPAPPPPVTPPPVVPPPVVPPVVVPPVVGPAGPLSPAIPAAPRPGPSPSGNPPPTAPPTTTGPAGPPASAPPPGTAPAPGPGSNQPAPASPPVPAPTPAPGPGPGPGHSIAAPSIGSPTLVAGAVSGAAVSPDHGQAPFTPIAVLSFGPPATDRPVATHPPRLGGSAGPVTDAEALALVRRTIFKTDSGYGFYPADDETRDFARAILPREGIVTLDLHGRSDGFRIENGLLAPRQFIAALRELSRTGGFELPPGAAIKLLSADTAAGQNPGGDGTAMGGIAGPPAAMLARELGVEVMAPDRPLWTDLAGDEILASPCLVHGMIGPAEPPDGRWHRFDPSGRAILGPPVLDVLDPHRSPVAS